MNLEIKIDSEAVQAQLVSAITNSAIGEQIQKAITKVLTEYHGSGFGDRKTIIESCVYEALVNVIRDHINQMIDERKDEIRQKISESLTDETLKTITDKVWELTLSGFGKRY